MTTKTPRADAIRALIAETNRMVMSPWQRHISEITSPLVVAFAEALDRGWPPEMARALIVTACASAIDSIAGAVCDGVPSDQRKREMMAALAKTLMSDAGLFVDVVGEAVEPEDGQ